MRCFVIVLILLLVPHFALAESLCVFTVSCNDVDGEMVIAEGRFLAEPVELGNVRTKEDIKKLKTEIQFVGMVFLTRAAMERRIKEFGQCKGSLKRYRVGKHIVELRKGVKSGWRGGSMGFMRDTEEEVRSLLNAICPEKVAPDFIPRNVD